MTKNDTRTQGKIQTSSEEAEDLLAQQLARLFLVQLGVIDNKYFPFEEELSHEKK